MVKDRTVVRAESRSLEVGHGPVRLRVTNVGQNQNLLEMRVEYEKAEPPAKAYYADFCNVLRGRGGVSLVFGKLSPGTMALRNKVEIVFAEETFIRQFWKNTRELHKVSKEQFDKHPLPPITPADTDIVQSFRANAVFMIGMSEEALIDFYYVAPSDIHFAYTKKRSDIHLEPVIRVVLPGSLMFEMLEQSGPVAQGLADYERIMKEEPVS